MRPTLGPTYVLRERPTGTIHTRLRSYPQGNTAGRLPARALRRIRRFRVVQRAAGRAEVVCRLAVGRGPAGRDRALPGARAAACRRRRGRLPFTHALDSARRVAVDEIHACTAGAGTRRS